MACIVPDLEQWLHDHHDLSFGLYHDQCIISTYIEEKKLYHLIPINIGRSEAEDENFFYLLAIKEELTLAQTIINQMQ